MAVHESEHISLSPVVFYFLLGAAGLGGLGGGTALTPKLQQSALQSCYDNSEIALESSQTALNVAAQHGDELQTLRELILERTRDRYTDEDAKDDWNRQYRVNQEVFRRLERLEK